VCAVNEDRNRIDAMQTLWTRALQVKSGCRCPSCATPQRALARRVNTAPTKHRIRPFGDSLALFGTTIFVAAAADARYKEARREELDGALLRAREDLQAIDEDQARRLANLGIHTRSRRGSTGSDVAYKFGPRSTQNAGTQVPWTFAQNAPAVQNEELLELDEPASESEEDQRLLESYKSDLMYGSSDGATTTTSEGINLPARVEEPSSQTESTAACTTKDTATRKLKAQYRKNRQYFAKVDSQITQDKLTRVLLNSTPVDPHHGRPVEQCWSSRANQRLTERQLLVRQRAVAKLVYKLILLRIHHTDSFDVQMPDGRVAQYTQQDTEAITDTIRDLDTTHRGLLQSASKAIDLLQWIESLPFPLYKRHGEELRLDSDKGLRRQSEHLKDFFAQPMDVNDRLSRLCSILACQTWAPNTHMFNMLILKLSELGLSRAVHYVTEAFIESGAIPNEISHTAILNSYASSGRASNFMSYLGQMDGLAANGGLLPREMRIPPNRPDLTEEQLKDYRQQVGGDDAFAIYAHDRSKNAVDEYQHQGAKRVGYKVPRTPYMYEAIVAGLLTFSKIDRAMQEYSRMIRSGMQPTADIYYSFLRYCVRTKAWSLGWNLWLQLNVESRSLDSVLYYWMLQLCAFCGKKKQFKSIVDSAVRRGDIELALDIEHFQWSEKEYAEVFRKSDLVERMQREVQLPDCSMQAVQYPHPQFKGVWPANLHTMVQSQFSMLLQWKKDGVGLPEEYTKACVSAGTTAETQQWLVKDLGSGTSSLTADSRWKRRGRSEFEEYMAHNTKIVKDGCKLAPHMATL
jgi:hypothetical protein